MGEHYTPPSPSANTTSFQNYSGCFRPQLRTSRVSPGYRGIADCRQIRGKRITNKSELKKGLRMMGDTGPGPLGKRNALLAIAVGGGIAGTLDLLQACMLFEWDIPLVIAGGLLGRQAFQGGVGTYVLGVVLHFFIACSAAAVYYGGSRQLGFLNGHPPVCGLFFCAAVGNVKRFIVFPLPCLYAQGPYTLHYLVLGPVVPTLGVGLP